jgi:tellurite methyltransferase
VSSADRERWNAKYREEGSVPEPSSLLAAVADRLPVSGRALDVAGGAGRNARWLIKRGLQVTIADVSDEGLRIAGAAVPGVQTILLDLESEPLPVGPWDLILVSHYLHRPLFAQFPALLAPGGLLLVAHPTLKNLEKNPRPGRHFLLEDGELPGLVTGLEILDSREGWLDSGRHEAWLLARKAVS